MRHLATTVLTMLLWTSGPALAQQHNASAAPPSVTPDPVPVPYQLTTPRRQGAVRARYEPVAREQLPGLIGETLRIQTNNGHLVEGTLHEVRREQLRIRQEINNGVAILPVRYDLIRRIERIAP